VTSPTKQNTKVESSFYSIYSRKSREWVEWGKISNWHYFMFTFLLVVLKDKYSKYFSCHYPLCLPHHYIVTWMQRTRVHSLKALGYSIWWPHALFQPYWENSRFMERHLIVNVLEHKVISMMHLYMYTHTPHTHTHTSWNCTSSSSMVLLKF
jgi:hypothetical protein